MASVFAVANYILQRLGGMTTLKLQKLTYYCQAYSLAWDGVPLFPEDFQAWANGPVCPQLFASHRGAFFVNSDAYSKYDAEFSKASIETMEVVLDAYGDKEPNWLKDLTHDERPWQQARIGYAPGEPSTVIINKEIMQDYYGQ